MGIQTEIKHNRNGCHEMLIFLFVFVKKKRCDAYIWNLQNVFCSIQRRYFSPTRVYRDRLAHSDNNEPCKLNMVATIKQQVPWILLQLSYALYIPFSRYSIVCGDTIWRVKQNFSKQTR